MVRMNSSNGSELLNRVFRIRGCLTEHSFSLTAMDRRDFLKGVGLALAAGPYWLRRALAQPSASSSPFVEARIPERGMYSLQPAMRREEALVSDTDQTLTLRVRRGIAKLQAIEGPTPERTSATDATLQLAARTPATLQIHLAD